jgi:adenylate cyclase class IV
MSNKFKEIELKYDATKVKLTDFQKLMGSMSPKILIETSSWDHYYTNLQDEFIRYRKSEIKPELTIKRKLHDKNNQQRIEINVALGDGDQDEVVDQFVKLLGYKENFKIYKSCFIYYFDEVDVVFYIVYDENMDEVGRFLEIEYLEELAHDKKTSHIMSTLGKYEKKLSKLNIKTKDRLSKSLFEMFKK